MKIGILTYHAACNFGANLQALSTFNYWLNSGHEPIFINWMTQELEDMYLRITPPKQLEEHKRFREKYFPMTRRCYNDEDVVSVIEEEGIDAIIVGSDAVMQTRPMKSRYKLSLRKVISIYKPAEDITCPNPFWGSYYSKLARKIPLIYMSASSQNSPYKSSNCKEKRLQKKLLLQYDYISTRDDWTSKMVSWLTDNTITPKVTPDPVFAFNYNVPNQPTKRDILVKYGLNEKYCLFCFHNDKAVSQEWLKKMEKRMNERGVECIAFPFPQGVEFHHPFKKQIDLPLSPIDWYALIKYADYYIGDNMHPIVICLHNAVPCFSFDQYGIVKFRYFVNKYSSKIYHILNKFNIPNNRVSLCGFYKEPTVEYVLNKLDSFNKKEIQKRANSYLEEYKAMMSDINMIIASKTDLKS